MLSVLGALAHNLVGSRSGNIPKQGVELVLEAVVTTAGFEPHAKDPESDIKNPSALFWFGKPKTRLAVSATHV